MTDEEITFQQTQALAEEGHAPAQFNLGYYYNKGMGVEQDYAKAVEWFTKAAGQGLAEGQFNLGLCFYLGEGVAKDKAKALEWWTLAAEQGFADAQKALERLRREQKTAEMEAVINGSKGLF